VPNISVVRRGVLIRSITKLDNGLGGISTVRNLSQSLALPITGVVNIFQMMFTSSITTIHVNRITDRPLMSLMAIGRYKNVNVVHPKRGYREPIIVNVPIFMHVDRPPLLHLQKSLMQFQALQQIHKIGHIIMIMWPISFCIVMISSSTQFYDLFTFGIMCFLMNPLQTTKSEKL
jgi:hypothetical protein